MFGSNCFPGGIAGRKSHVTGLRVFSGLECSKSRCGQVRGCIGMVLQESNKSRPRLPQSLETF